MIGESLAARLASTKRLVRRQMSPVGLDRVHTELAQMVALEKHPVLAPVWCG